MAPPKKKNKKTPTKKDNDHSPSHHQKMTTPKKTIHSESKDEFSMDVEPSEEFSSSTMSFTPVKNRLSTSQGGRKRSFKMLSAEHSSYIPLNDDCNELSEDSEDDQKNMGVQTSKPEDEQELSIIRNMTIEEMQEHVSQCLQLNTENKINSKNAFALKLIDCMAIIQKSSGESNFAAMACQLDAGAKIYSHRVDALHQQTMKLVERCIVSDKKFKKQNDDDDETAEVNDDILADKQQGKKKKSKKSVITTSEHISRKLKENDPREKYVRCEALPGGIFEKVNREPKDLSLTLNKDEPFWMDWREYSPTKASGDSDIDFKGITLKNRRLGPALEIESTFDFSSIPNLKYQSDEENDDFDEPMVDFDKNDDIYGSQESVFDEEKSVPEQEVEMISIAMSRMAENCKNNVSRLDAIKAVFHRPDDSDYHYLKMDNSSYWAGPDYWKRPHGVGAAANKKKILRKKKEPLVLEYTEESSKRKSFNRKNSITGLTSKRSTILSHRVMNKWQKKKVTYPIDIHFRPQTMFMLFHIEVVSDKIFECQLDPTPDGGDIHQPGNLALDESDNEVNNDDGIGNEFENEDNGQESDEEVHQDLDEHHFDEEEEDDEEQLGAVAGPSGAGPSSSSNDLYEGENLVPMVKTVKVDPIQYTARPNRVDMRHLKEVLLKIILHLIEDREDNVEDENALRFTTFAVVLAELFSSEELHPRTRSDLTTQMAFMALLTLANENNLMLENDEDGDVKICKYSDMFPDEKVLHNTGPAEDTSDDD